MFKKYVNISSVTVWNLGVTAYKWVTGWSPQTICNLCFKSFLLCTLSLLLLFVNEINILNIILNSKALLEKQNISFSWTLIPEKYYFKNAFLVFK